MSRTNDPVAPDAHRRWLDGVLGDDGRLLLVASIEDEAVGTVRFDREADDLWEVSITMSPDARGRGLARPVLAAAERAWRRQVGTTPQVFACVRPDNAASARLFVGAGYRQRARARADGLDTYVRD
jgi:RimJ/RimL family protein N-acetyltransferase